MITLKSISISIGKSLYTYLFVITDNQFNSNDSKFFGDSSPKCVHVLLKDSICVGKVARQLWTGVQLYGLSSGLAALHHAI